MTLREFRLGMSLSPLVICVHAVTVSGHLLQFPVPALHPSGPVVALLDQHLKESTLRLVDIKKLPQQQILKCLW